MRQVTLKEIQRIIGNVIGDTDLAGELQTSSALLGAIPELDSMAVVNLMLGLEETYGFHVDDSEVEVEIFETVGSLGAFAQAKLNAMGPDS